MNISYWRIVISLTVVVVIMIPILFLLKKVNFFSISSSKGIKVLERFMLGNGVYLLIAEILGKYYLLSLSSQGISLLKELNSAEEVAQIIKLYNLPVEFGKLISGNVSNSAYQNSGFLPENEAIPNIDPDFYKLNVNLKKDILNNIDRLKLKK